MIKRAIARAVENGFAAIQFVDISPNPTPQITEALRQLAGEWKDIEVEFIGKASLKEGMKLLTQPSDIVLGVKSAETVGIIEFMASRGNAIATYVPETRSLDRYNLASISKNVDLINILLKSSDIKHISNLFIVKYSNMPS